MIRPQWLKKKIRTLWATLLFCSCVLVLVCPSANKALNLQLHKGKSNSSCSESLPPLMAHLYGAYTCGNCNQLGLNIISCFCIVYGVNVDLFDIYQFVLWFVVKFSWVSIEKFWNGNKWALLSEVCWKERVAECNYISWVK